MKNTRRIFLKKAGAGFVALGALPTLAISSAANGQKTEKKAKKEDLFKIAVAGYTFVKFKLDPALEMIERVGINYLCIKDFHLPLDSTADEIAEFHEKLKAKNIVGYGVGPIYMKTEADADRAFDYAKRVGVKLIVGVPIHELLPYIDKKIKEYDFLFAIHIHGPEDKLYPSLQSVHEKVKNFDTRLGMCHDIGYSMMLGLDPADETLKYNDRIHDMHIKDVTSASPQGKDCEVGRGVIDFPSLIKALRKVKYKGMCSFEYEKDNTDPLAGLAESVGYFKGVLKTL